MNSINQSMPRASLIVALALACFVFLPSAPAVSPPPDGGYPGGNTAEGENALFSLTSGVGNTGVGWYSLFANSIGSYNTALGAGSLDLNNADKTCLVSSTSILIGRIIHTRLILASSTMSSRHALAGHRLRGRCHYFASISPNCSLPLHHSLHLYRLQGQTGCCPDSHRKARIGYHLLREVGVIPHALRWPVLGCALTTIRRRQRMTHSTGSPS
jgi:hypothetical protein